jgi:ribosomal protein S2
MTPFQGWPPRRNDGARASRDRAGSAADGSLALKVAERQSVADIVKLYAERVGLDPALFAAGRFLGGYICTES